MQISSGLKLLYFYGGYHSNCNITLDILNRINKARPDIEIIKINTLNNYDLKIKYNLKALPALVLIKDDMIINKMSGSINYHSVLKMLEV